MIFSALALAIAYKATMYLGRDTDKANNAYFVKYAVLAERNIGMHTDR